MARANRRVYPRHIKRINVRFKEPGKDWRSAFTTDISVGGMYISSRAIPASDTIEIELTLDDETMTLTARVIRGVKVANRLQRIQRGGFAVEIIQPAPEQWYARLLAIGQRKNASA